MSEGFSRPLQTAAAAEARGHLLSKARRLVADGDMISRWRWQSVQEVVSGLLALIDEGEGP